MLVLATMFPAALVFAIIAQPNDFTAQLERTRIQKHLARVQYEIVDVYKGERYDDTCITEIQLERRWNVETDLVNAFRRRYHPGEFFDEYGEPITLRVSSSSRASGVK